MRITHPIAPYQGFDPENVFFVSDEKLTQLGTGFIVRFEQPCLYPERPLHFYISIEAQPQARNMLFGALLARAEQMRAENPGIPARMYAAVPADNTELIRFYEQCGLKDDDAEDMLRFPVPVGTQTAPMGMDYYSVPLNTLQERTDFLERINFGRIQPFDPDYLTMWQQQPHFLALTYHHDDIPVCELVLTGAGETATLLHVYTLQRYRRQHLATQLIGAAGDILASRGVTHLYTQINRRNKPQVNMMEKLQASFVRTVTCLPGIDL